MDLSIVELRSFVTIAEHGSFQSAAATLAISQSALTRRIQKLEESLGVHLLERNTRNVSLSAVGREFFPKARRLLDDLEASLLSVREISSKASGQINVACLPTVATSFLPDVLRRFNQNLPRIRVRIIDEVANTVLRSVLDGDADFGINLPNTDEPGIEFSPLFEEHFVLACPVHHPLTRKKSVEWGDLADQALIRAGRLNGNRNLVDMIFVEQGIVPKWSFEVQHLTTSLGLISTGLGISVIPDMIVRNRPYRNVVTRPIVNPSLHRSIGLIRRRGSTLSPAAWTLFDLLKETFSRQQPLPRRSKKA